MKKTLKKLLPSLEKEGLEYKIVQDLGSPLLEECIIEDLAFDSRKVTKNSLFFALPGTHTSGNRFVKDAIEAGASAIVFEGDFSAEEREELAKYPSKATFIQVKSSRFAMSPLSASFYDNPSQKLVIYGVTGTEGKSSTVSFIWQLLTLCGLKAGFISTVQYSLGGPAINNPEHQTTPEAPIVQKELYQMLENGCTHAVVESSSHGLSSKTNRLGNVEFDVAVFTNVTLEHLEFHKTFDQYRSDKANLFRALDKYDHKKTISGLVTQVPSIGIVNLEDPSASYFAACTKKKVFGFTSEGKAGSAKALPEIPADMPYLAARNIVSARYGMSFSIYRFENHDSLQNGNRVIHVKAPVAGAFNAYNIMAAMLAVSATTGKSLEDLASLLQKLVPVTGRMTVVDCGQDFEVIVDYAHTPSSFETIFPPLKKRCAGKMICLFGSGGERDTKKRPLQGQIAARFCDTVILTDEDPRFEDSMKILQDIAAGAVAEGKTEGKDLFLIADRKAAIRKAFSLAQKDDIVLLLGKSHENSIIYKDKPLPYDEIAEAEKALNEMKK